MQKVFFVLLAIFFSCHAFADAEYMFFRWKPDSSLENFGDKLSDVVIRKMAKREVSISYDLKYPKKILCLGSIIHFASDGDVIWGSGINGKHKDIKDYQFKKLDVRAVRGPKTRDFLEKMGIKCPKIYGDPSLLLPRLFPKLKPNPTAQYIVIPQIAEIELFRDQPNVVQPYRNWKCVIQEILKAKFVISGSLHGIIVAEAFGIPARWLRASTHEDPFKYEDYFEGTGRFNEKYATSVEEALKMGGHPPPKINYEKLYKAFPFEFIKEDTCLQID